MKLKSSAEEAKQEERKQSTVTDVAIRRKECKTQGKGMPYNFVCALNSDSMNVRIIMDVSPDVMGKLTVNVVFTYHDVDHNAKAINLFNIAIMKVVIRVFISRALSTALDGNKKWWNDVVALAVLST